MATIRISGANVPLPNFPGLINNTTGVGVPGQAGYYTGITNALTLAAGETWQIPAGTWWVTVGPYTFLQYLEPVTQTYKARPCAGNQAYQQMVVSDGVNFRLANTTGCPTSAVITTATCTGAVNGIGTAINLVSCAPSSGASTWQTIVGGAIAATIATATASNTTAGSGYTYIPVVVIDAPPTGGLQATAIVTSLATGTIPAANIQVLNQGAGYPTAPNMNFVNDPRDTTGSGAFYVTTLTATGQLTGLYPINHGTTLTGVPALTFALTNGGTVSCAATAIMNFTVTGFTTTTGGTSYPIVGVPITSFYNSVTPQTIPTVNPLHVSNTTFPRPARITGGTGTGAIVATLTATGTVVEDGGLGIQQVPTLAVLAAYTSTTGVAAALTATVGGVSDTSYIQPV